MNVNCGCAAMKLLSCSREVEIVATHESSSRKPATFRKLNELSSLTSSSSRNDRNVNAHSPKVRSTSTSIDEREPERAGDRVLGVDAGDDAHQDGERDQEPVPGPVGQVGSAAASHSGPAPQDAGRQSAHA